MLVAAKGNSAPSAGPIKSNAANSSNGKRIRYYQCQASSIGMVYTRESLRLTGPLVFYGTEEFHSQAAAQALQCHETEAIWN
jgi:hypothetical protein